MTLHWDLTLPHASLPPLWTLQPGDDVRIRITAERLVQFHDQVANTVAIILQCQATVTIAGSESDFGTLRCYCNQFLPRVRLVLASND